MRQCVLICVLVVQGKKNFWYLDSGCSRHMTCCKSFLSDYVEKDGHVVMFGDNKKGRNKGFGSIQCMTMELKDVSYVKGLRHHLIYISQLCDATYKVYFSEKEGYITDSKNSILLTALKKNTFMCLMCLLLLRHYCFVFLVLYCVDFNTTKKSFALKNKN